MGLLSFISQENETEYFAKFEVLITIGFLSLLSIILNLIGISFAYLLEDIPVEVWIIFSFCLLTIIVYSISVIIKNIDQLNTKNVNSLTIMVWILVILLFSMAIYSFIVLIFKNYLGAAKLNSTDFFSFLGVLMTFLFVIVTAISVNISKQALSKSDKAQIQTKIQINLQQKQINIQNLDKRKAEELSKVDNQINLHKEQLEKYYIPLYNCVDDLVTEIKNYNQTLVDFHLYTNEYKMSKDNLNNTIKKTRNIIQQFVYLEQTESQKLSKDPFIFSLDVSNTFTIKTDELLQNKNKLTIFRDIFRTSPRFCFSIVSTIIYVAENMRDLDYTFYLNYFLIMLKTSLNNSDYKYQDIVDDVFRTKNLEKIKSNIDYLIADSSNPFWENDRATVYDEFVHNVPLFLNALHFLIMSLNDEILDLENQKKIILEKYSKIKI